MSTISIEIVSKNYNLKMSLERRLTVLKGNSGEGKTSLLDIVRQDESSREDAGIMLNSTLPVVALGYKKWKEDMMREENCIFILDDLYIVESVEFANLYKKYAVSKNWYIIIINRAELYELSDEIDSVYRFIGNGKYHYIEPY